MTDTVDPGAPPADPTPPEDGAAPPAPPANWTDGLDAATRSMFEARGFRGAGDIAAKLKEFDPPDSPDKYEIPAPDGADAAYLAAMKEAAHKAGIPPQYVKALAEAQNAFAATQSAAAQEAQAAAERAAVAQTERDQQALKQEWGETHTAKLEGARRAALAFTPGQNEADKMAFLTTMESRFGYAGMMKFWAAIGDHMAEAPAHGLGGSVPPQANAQSFYGASNMNP